MSRESVARLAPDRTCESSPRISRRYGDESVYFDLKDLENTAGAWSLYAQDDKRRYPELQNEFFNRWVLQPLLTPRASGPCPADRQSMVCNILPAGLASRWLGVRPCCRSARWLVPAPS